MNSRFQEGWIYKNAKNVIYVNKRNKRTISIIAFEKSNWVHLGYKSCQIKYYYLKQATIRFEEVVWFHKSLCEKIIYNGEELFSHCYEMEWICPLLITTECAAYIPKMQKAGIKFDQVFVKLPHDN